MLKKEKKFGNPEAVIGTVESHGSAQTPVEGKGLPTRADLDEEFDGGNKSQEKSLPQKIKSSQYVLILSKCNWR